MEPELIGAYIGAGASLIIGIAGFATACVSNSRAKKANKHAETANDIATKALGKAAEANKIAEDANKLSADANSIISRQAAQRTEQHLVEWGIDPHVDREPALILRNHGRDTANNVSISIRGKNMYETRDGYGNVASENEITVTLPQTVQDQLGKMRASGFVGDITTYSRVVQKLTVEVRWFTDLGNPRDKSFEIKVK